MALPLKLLIDTALKGLFIEASWNKSGQQNLGFAAALESSLLHIYKGRPEDLGQARKRVSHFFNTHPIMSGPILGVALNLEEQLSQGTLDETRYGRLMSALSSALAALGDAFFWCAYLPFCVVLSMWIALALNWPWGALLVPVFFSLLHLPFRFGGFYLGYKRGLGIFQLVDRLRLHKWAQIINKTTAVILGTLTALFINHLSLANGLKQGGIGLFLLGILALAFILIFFTLIRKFRMVELWIYLIVIVSVLIGFFEVACNYLIML